LEIIGGSEANSNDGSGKIAVVQLIPFDDIALVCVAPYVVSTEIVQNC
jgi:hypothetical protein